MEELRIFRYQQAIAGSEPPEIDPVPVRPSDADGRYVCIPEFPWRWFVRWVDEARVDAPAVEIGGNLVPLDSCPAGEPGGFHLPKGARPFGQTGGVCRFYDRGSTTAREVFPRLYVEPPMEPQVYAAILDRLRERAVAVKSAIVAPLRTRQTDGRTAPDGGCSLELQRDRAAGERFLELFRVVQEQLDLILRNPARSLRHAPCVVDTRRPTDRSTGRAAKTPRPEGTRTYDMGLLESADTTENQFLAHVLSGTLLAGANGVADHLSERAHERRREATDLEAPGPYRQLWLGLPVKLRNEADEIDSLAREVRRAGEWAAARLADPFFAELSLDRPSGAPSRRLTDSPEYGPLYDAYRTYCSGSLLGVVETPDPSRITLRERPVDRLVNLYEKWVFLEVYAILVETFGFVPDSSAGQPCTPFDESDRTDLIPDLRRGQTFRLSWSPRTVHPPGRPEKVTIDLHYDVEHYDASGKPKRPDVRLEVSFDDTWAMECVLDAKYKKVLLEKDESYIFDMLAKGVFENEYLERFGPTFLIHPSPAAGLTILGEQPLGMLGRERSEHLDIPYDEWPRHRYGSVYALPDDQGKANLRRLLDCILMYHMGLDDVCWRCGDYLLPEPVPRKDDPSRPGRGKAFICRAHGEFSVRTNCPGAGKHKLIKRGSRSFHATASHDKWICICPECGLGPHLGS
jgi:hypothetical protein